MPHHPYGLWSLRSALVIVPVVLVLAGFVGPNELSGVRTFAQTSGEGDASGKPEPTAEARSAALTAEAETAALAEVKAFIAGGGSVNAVDDDGQTRLYLAVAEKYRRVVEYLVANGADVCAKGPRD